LPLNHNIWKWSARLTKNKKNSQKINFPLSPNKQQVKKLCYPVKTAKTYKTLRFTVTLQNTAARCPLSVERTLIQSFILDKSDCLLKPCRLDAEVTISE